MTVLVEVDNGGQLTVTNANGGTVSSNGTSSVTISNVNSGTIALNYTSPTVDTMGFGFDFFSATATDSGGLHVTWTFGIDYW
jgi:hypothetical protein